MVKEFRIVTEAGFTLEKAENEAKAHRALAILNGHELKNGRPPCYRLLIEGKEVPLDFSKITHELSDWVVEAWAPFREYEEIT